jgi:Zn-dependent peptidase ImmA (M78 family)
LSGQNFIVPARSWDNIEQVAQGWRSGFGLDQTPFTPIMQMMEQVLDNRLNCFTLIPVEVEEMGPAEGYTDPDGQFIMLREDVYKGAWRGEVRDRFTAAHELSHWAIHTKIALARAMPGQDVPAFRLSEPQANQFAGELLMPAKFFSRFDTIRDVMERHGVGYQAASHRLDYLTRKRKIIG